MVVTPYLRLGNSSQANQFLKKVLENAQNDWSNLLMGLMLLIFGSDIYKFIISPFLK